MSEILCPWQPVDGETEVMGGEKRPLVVVPDLTFVATANAPFTCGARVVTADCAPGSAFPGPREVREAIERAGGDLPAAIVVVHYAGFDAGAEAMALVADQLGCPLIEDAAHAIGGRTESGQALGTVGLAGCYSFFSNKNLSTGEGGLIATNDDQLAAALRLRRSHGMTSLTWQRHQGRASSYDVLTAGRNLRITEITAALARVQLSRLDSGNAARRRLWRRYAEAFSNHPRLSVPLGGLGESAATLENSACHIFPLLADSTLLRDQIRANLAEQRIQTSHHYPPIHSFEFWSRAMADSPASGDGACAPRPVSADFATRELTLPLHPRLTTEQQDTIIEAVLASIQ
jgi:dTDP-4-amino-4,6-dideoxygalactose transaminase